MAEICLGCRGRYNSDEDSRIGIEMVVGQVSETHYISYCPGCVEQLKSMDSDALTDLMEVFIAGVLKNNPTKAS